MEIGRLALEAGEVQFMQRLPQKSKPLQTRQPRFNKTVFSPMDIKEQGVQTSPSARMFQNLNDKNSQVNFKN